MLDLATRYACRNPVLVLKESQIDERAQGETETAQTQVGK